MFQSTPFYTVLKNSLEAKNLCYLQVDEEGALKTVSFYAKILRIINPKRASEDVAKICALFEKILATSPLYPSIQKALESDELLLAKKLYQEQKKLCSQEDPRICSFTGTFFIKSTNLPKEALSTSQELASFLKKHHIHKNLAFYGKSARYDESTRAVYFPTKDGEISLESFQRQIQLAKAANATQSISWLIGMEGAQVEDLYNWEHLRPVRKIEGWTRGYVIEICTCCVETPRFTQGDHCWIRLYEESGLVYSVGQYRYRNKEITLSQSKMFLQCPDISEFWDFEEIQTTFWPIDKEAFTKTKHFFEESQRQILSLGNAPSLTYDPVKNNCTAFALKALGVAGIEVAAVKPIWYILLPSSGRALADALDKVKNPFLKTAIKISGFIPDLLTTFFINFLQCSLGASKICHKAPHNLPKSCPSRYPSFLSLFDKEQASMAHPFIVSEIARKSKKHLFEKGFLNKSLSL